MCRVRFCVFCRSGVFSPSRCQQGFSEGQEELCLVILFLLLGPNIPFFEAGGEWPWFECKDSFWGTDPNVIETGQRRRQEQLHSFYIYLFFILSCLLLIPAHAAVMFANEFMFYSLFDLVTIPG